MIYYLLYLYLYAVYCNTYNVCFKILITFRVIFADEGLQFSIIEKLTHCVQDRRDLKDIYVATLGGVEHLEGLAEHGHLLFVFRVLQIIRQ